MKKLPECCEAHVAKYVAIAPKQYPREGAALCCAACWARLVYHGGVWGRTSQEAIHMKAVLDHVTLKPQPKAIGLLAGLEGGDS